MCVSESEIEECMRFNGNQNYDFMFMSTGWSH